MALPPKYPPKIIKGMGQFAKNILGYPITPSGFNNKKRRYTPSY
jgi:hypothetical protein|tara:strand:- start:183 stop:314 length:132 start_codon:yes stop_codon:yes gene_type:complete